MTVPVLVLRLEGMFFTWPIGIIRSLEEWECRVRRRRGIGLRRPLSPVSDWRHSFGDARSGCAAALGGHAIIGERLNRPTIVIPTDDAAAILIAEQGATLQRWFLFPQQPAMLPRHLANKENCICYAAESEWQARSCVSEFYRRRAQVRRACYGSDRGRKPLSRGCFPGGCSHHVDLRDS